MAAIRIQMQDAQWFNWGYNVVRIAGDKFSMQVSTSSATTSVLNNFVTGRKMKLYDSTTMYATIVESSLSGSLVNVTVTMDSGSLTNSFSSAYLSIITPTNNGIPGGGGTVTSVGFAIAPTLAGTVTGSPITGAGTITLTSKGNLIGVKYLTTGTGATYTPTAGTTAILVEMMGAGGGGGGVAPTISTFSCSGGGGAGGYAQRYITGITGAYSATYTVSAGGTGGTGNVNGNAGGNTTYDDGTISMTAIGGAGGGGCAGITAGSIGGFGGEGNGATGGTIITDGGTGGWGMCSNVSGNICQSGAGGTSHFSGGGTDARVTTAMTQNGVNGTIGGGGGGAAGLATATAGTGGTGGAGIIIIYEFS